MNYVNIVNMNVITICARSIHVVRVASQVAGPCDRFQFRREFPLAQVGSHSASLLFGEQTRSRPDLGYINEGLVRLRSERR